MNNEKLSKLKKKLFTLAAYLLVSASLLVYVSYSQYKIKYEATVIMPKVYTMKAGLKLYSKTGEGGAEENRGLVQNLELASGTDLAETVLTTEDTVVINGFLDELMPGNVAATYASTGDADGAQHKLIIAVDNALGGTADAEASRLGIKYSLSVSTDGILPLHFILIDKNGAECSLKTNHTGSKTEEQYFKDADGKPVEFELPAGEYSINDHNVYVGWNNEDANGRNIELCKEIDKIVIKAHITGLRAPQIQYGEAPTVTQENVYHATE